MELHLKVKSSHVKKRYINEKIIKRANQLTGDIWGIKWDKTLNNLNLYHLVST